MTEMVPSPSNSGTKNTVPRQEQPSHSSISVNHPPSPKLGEPFLSTGHHLPLEMESNVTMRRRLNDDDETSLLAVLEAGNDNGQKIATESAAVGNTPSTERATNYDDDARGVPRVWRFFNKFIFPKAEPLPWMTFIELALVCSVPAITYILFFTKMGFGLTTFYWLSSQYQHLAPGFMTGLTIFFLFLYMFDFSYWGKASNIGRDFYYLSWSALIIGIVVLVLLITEDYPYGPICLFAILTPIALMLIKIFSFPNQETRVFVSWLSGPLFSVSMLTALGWLLWTFLDEDNEWNDVNQVKDAASVGCKPDFDTYPNCNINGEVCFYVEGITISYPQNCPQNCANVYDDCLNTFIVWVGPLLISVLFFFLSFFCTFLRSETPEADAVNFGKLWLFLLFAMWCTASLVGAGAGVTSALAAFTLTSFVGSFVFLGASYSSEQQIDTLTEVWGRLKDKYEGYLDVVKGLLVVTCTPVALVYILLSIVNQSIRKIGCPCTKKLLTEEDIKGWVTKRARKQIREFQTWNYSKVFTYAIYWGIAFMTLQVIVAQFTLLFLSWLIEEMNNYNLWTVTGFMFGIGTIMFLLPPVPGVPIYLTLGIVVIASGRDLLGIPGCIAYCVVVSLVMKLFACMLQQKMIGENLSHFVSVRQMCQINTHLIRSMRLILSEPGLKVSKVAILIGGPDWPTSVLCGIMRLGLFQILLGTVPVVCLITPTVLTGSFTYMSSLRDKDTLELEFPWAGTVATIMTAITALVQFGSMIVAAFFLEKAATERVDELEKMPYDEDVRVADEKGQQKKIAYEEVTEWKSMPVWAKGILISSLVLMIICCYLVQLFQGLCFAEYELTYTIDEHLDGNWTNLVLPLGRLAILFFAISIVLLLIFIEWAKITANRNRSAVHLSSS